MPEMMTLDELRNISRERTPLEQCILDSQDLEDMRDSEYDVQEAAVKEFAKLRADYTKAIKANREVAKLNADLQEDLTVQTERLRTAREALSWIASNDPKGKGDAYYHSEQSGTKARAALEHLGP